MSLVGLCALVSFLYHSPQIEVENIVGRLASVAFCVAIMLDSYSAERVLAAHENLHQGMKSTEFMSPPSFGFELMRTAVLGLAVRHSFVRSLINPRQTRPVSYFDSPLNRPAGDIDEFAAGPEVGAVLQECPATLFEQGNARKAHLTELVSPGFTAFCFTQEGSVPETLKKLEHSLQAAGVPFRLVTLSRERPFVYSRPAAWDHTGRLFPMYGASPGTVYLVRPDGHVLARWQRFLPSACCDAIEHTLHCPTGSRAS